MHAKIYHSISSTSGSSTSCKKENFINIRKYNITSNEKYIITSDDLFLVTSETNSVSKFIEAPLKSVFFLQLIIGNFSE